MRYLSVTMRMLAQAMEAVNYTPMTIDELALCVRLHTIQEEVLADWNPKYQMGYSETAGKAYTKNRLAIEQTRIATVINDSMQLRKEKNIPVPATR